MEMRVHNWKMHVHFHYLEIKEKGTTRKGERL